MSLVIGLALCAFGGLLAVAGVRRLGTAISIHRSDAVPLREVPACDGHVEFDGRAEPNPGEEPLEAPFSGEAALCCAVWMGTDDRYRTDAEGLEVGDANEPETYRNTEQSWQLTETDELRRPFVVTDGVGRVSVDPAGAKLDLAGHMGETVLTVDEGETLPDEVRDRLATLERADGGFDGTVVRWDREGDRVTYREARLEPGDPVHVAGGVVESVPEEWGSDVDAIVGALADSRFLISEGSESSVVRDHLVQFLTGVVVGAVLITLGLSTLGVSIPV